MQGFKISSRENENIRFEFYHDAAPATCKAFLETLPFTRPFKHARVSGAEIWIDDVPPIDVPQENASVFTEPGEVVIGPSKPARAKTANCFGIYYGEGKGLDACNIFAKVLAEDQQKLIALGKRIWEQGFQEIRVEAYSAE